VRTATSYNPYTPQGWTPGIFAVPNPPAGARIRYHLAAAADDVGIMVTDATGRDIRELEATGEAGLNEVVWDLRLVENDGGGEAMDPGPRVMPGTYLIQLTTGDNEVQSEVTVRLDPRVELGRREVMVRHQAMIESYRLSGPVDQAEEALSEIGDGLDEVEALLKRSGQSTDGLAEEIEELRAAAEGLEEELGDASDGAEVWSRIQSASAPPSADALWLIERSWERLPGVIDGVNALITQRMPALYGQVYADAVRPETGDPIAMPRPRG